MYAVLTNILLAAAGFLMAALGLGLFSGPGRGLALCTAGILGLLACQVVRARQVRERVRRPYGGPASTLTHLLPGATRAEESQWREALSPTQDSASPINTASLQTCGAGVLDRKYRILWCDTVSAAHLGIRGESDIGRPIDRILHGSSLIAYLAAGDFSKPLRLNSAVQAGRALSVWLVPYLEDRWLVLSLDVTQDIERDIARRDCVADALHELSSPITLLAGTLDAMRGFAFGPRRLRDSLDSMEEQCRRLQRTVESLLSLSTLESAPKSTCDERIDLLALFAAIHAEAQALSAGQHRIVLDAAGGMGLIGSGGEIASAFRNLACNAVRYTPPGGEIRLVWRALPAGGAEFSVEDNGIGIAKEHIPRLSERFFRVDRGFSRKTAGTGLGLAIVKDALTRHQATLDIESELGKGSRFTARFPARRVVSAAVPNTVPVVREVGTEAAPPIKGKTLFKMFAART